MNILLGDENHLRATGRKLGNIRTNMIRVLFLVMLSALMPLNALAKSPYPKEGRVAYFDTIPSEGNTEGSSVIEFVSDGAYRQTFLWHEEIRENIDGGQFSYSGNMAASKMIFVEKIRAIRKLREEPLSSFYLEISCDVGLDQHISRKECINSNRFEWGVSRVDYSGKYSYSSLLDFIIDIRVSDGEFIQRKIDITIEDKKRVLEHAKSFAFYVRHGIFQMGESKIGRAGMGLGGDYALASAFKAETKTNLSEAKKHSFKVLKSTSPKIASFMSSAKHGYEKFVREKSAFNVRVLEARARHKKNELRRQEAVRLERLREAERQNALRDREPTEAEMREAIGNTLAGVVFGAGIVDKVGACSKAGPYDYYCRYRYLTVNRGNFWKYNDQWHFKIAN